MRRPMKGPALAAVLVLLYASVLVLPVDGKCSATTKCPRELPCCFRDGLWELPGECGTGRSCTSGCDPLWSFSPGSCAPNPGCVNKTYQLPDLEGIAEDTKYLGNSSASQFSWVGEQPLRNYSDRIVVPFYPRAKETGTQLSLTRYMLFGTVKARLKIAERVATNLILLSDTGDYIRITLNPEDKSVGHYAFQSHDSIISGRAFDIPSDANVTLHDYEISWQPSRLTLKVNGVEVLSMPADPTWNDTEKRNYYPQTPARFMLLVKPSVSAPNNSSDLAALGYDYAGVNSITIECSSRDEQAGSTGSVAGNSYYYADNSTGTNDSIVISDRSTVLKNQTSTGLDLAAEANEAAANALADSLSGGLSPGAKAGIAVGVVVPACVAVAVFIWYRRRRKQKQEADRVVQVDAPPSTDAAATIQLDSDSHLHSQKAELDTTEIARHELPDPSPGVGPTGPAELLGDLVHGPRAELDTGSSVTSAAAAVESREKGTPLSTPKPPIDEETQDTATADADAAADAADPTADPTAAGDANATADADAGDSTEKKPQKDLAVDTEKSLAVSVASAQPSPISAMAVSPASNPEELEKAYAS